MQKLEPGTKVEYQYEGETRQGLIHAVKTHETPDGIITSISYLIDTGEVVRTDVTKVHPKTGKVLETVSQPEQVEIAVDKVRQL